MASQSAGLKRRFGRMLTIFCVMILFSCGYCQNLHSPTFSPLPAVVSISELASVGDTVIKCQATDDDSGPAGQLTYSITGGTGAGNFSVNATTCDITVAAQLDFESTNNYDIIIEVTDLDPTSPKSADVTLSVAVLDANDSPVLVKKTPTVLENSAAGTLVFDCTAKDEDSPSLPSGQLSYSLVSGNTGNAFTFSPPCRLTTSRPLDREVIDLYDLKIRVTDLDPTDPKSDTRVYSVMVADVNDHTPYFVDIPPMPIVLVEDYPVGIPISNCSGHDDDKPLQPTDPVVNCEIIAGNEDKLFTVNATTCELSLRKPLDFDTIWTHNITVRLSDLDPVAPRSVEQEFRICVDNINDHDPVWVTKMPSTMEVPENSPLGTYLGNCSASDADSPLLPSGQVRYRIKGGNKVGLFYMDPYTCDLYVNGLLDYETSTRHTLKIIAFDLDPIYRRNSKTMKVKVKIIDENDMGPICQASEMTKEISELTPASSVVMTLSCIDVDTGSGGTLRYTGERSSSLKVDSVSGEVVLQKKQDWDNIALDRQLDFQIVIKDSSDPKNSATATVHIIITDGDDIKPVFLQSDYVISISETTPRGATVLTVSATDGDAPDTPASTITYTMTRKANADWFFLDSLTGDFVITDTLDIDDDTQVVLNVYAHSSNMTDSRNKAKLTINIDNVHNTMPQFTQDVYHATVQENTIPTNPVLKIKATVGGVDSDVLGTLRYNLDDGPMEIDALSGEVRVTKALDYEDQYFYNVSVTVYDQRGPSPTATSSLVLIVQPRNEFDPVWTSGTHFTVSEDILPGSTVFQLSAVDSDAGWDGLVVFSFDSPPSLHSPFALDPMGKVVLTAPLDFDTVNSYTITATATDRSSDPRTATSIIHVTVSDVNDLPPECESLPAAVLPYPWATGSTIATVQCSADADTVNGQLSYRIVGGDLDSVFQVGSQNGELSVTSRPSHLQYDISVEIGDGGNPNMTSLMSVVILVEPELNILNLPINTSLSEGVDIGSVVFTPTACCSFTTFKFDILSGNEDHLFDVNAWTGDVTVVKQLDREMTSSHSLLLGVTDERGQASSATLLILLDDVNDNSPVFNPIFVTKEISELVAAGSSLGQHTATDLDSGSNAALTYSLLDTRDGRFSVDSATGVLRLDKDVDFETDDHIYTLHLVATDGGVTPLSATATLQIVVVDADEHIPQVITNPGTVTVREDFPLGSVLFVIKAIDEDNTDVISYSLLGDDLPFRVVPDSGEVILVSFLDREQVAAYHLTFECVSSAGDRLNLTVEVQVDDVDDNDPVFSSTVYQFYVPHNTAAGVIVGTVNVTDIDSGTNADFIVSLVSGNGAGYFSLDATQLKTARLMTYDGVREFLLTLRAQPAANATDMIHYAEAYVRIEVMSDSTIPKFYNNTLVVSVTENAAWGTVITDLSATALGATEGSAGTLAYRLVTGHGLFTVSPDTGVLSVAGNLDYEASSSHTVVVEAYNVNDQSVKDSITVTVDIINLNDNSPTQSSVVNQFVVNEDVDIGTVVGSVVFADDDDGVFGEFKLSLSQCPHFSIDPDSGSLYVAETLSYNEQRLHTCVVTAEDLGSPPLFGMSSVIIAVVDVNDHPPLFEGAPYTLNVLESTPPGTLLTIVRAVDMDQGQAGDMTYTLLSAVSGTVFLLNETTGELYLAAYLDATKTPQFVLELLADDGGSPPLTSNTTLSVNVIDVNDHAPVLMDTPFEVAIDRLSTPGTVIAVLNATDDDLLENARISFAIIAGNPEGVFFIDVDSGELTTRASLADLADTHTLTVSAADHGNPVLVTSSTVTVRLSPPSLNPPASATSSLAFNVSEDAAVDTVIDTIDSYPASQATDYVIVSGNYKQSLRVLTQPDGTGLLQVAGALDYEDYPLFYMVVSITTTAGELRKLVKVEVMDVNDNVPLFADGDFLVLYTAEDTPVGHTLWTLSVEDADSAVTNGAFNFTMLSTTVPGLLTVNTLGEIVLLASPDYETVQKVDAEITVSDNGVPQQMSSISVTLHILDVTETQEVQVVASNTVYISKEIPFNIQNGHVVHQLSVSDFELTTTSESTVTFLAINTNSAFAVNIATGEVTVTASHKLMDNSSYFQWIVCKVKEPDNTVQSEMAMLRIDTYDKYKNLIVIQTLVDVADLEAAKLAVQTQLESVVSIPRRVGIHSILPHGHSLRRRLLAAGSVVLVYVVLDIAADQLGNVISDKVFLTQKEILQMLQASADGTPVAALSTSPLYADLVMPYQMTENDDTSLVQSDYFPVIIALICVVLLLIVIFVVVCILCKKKRKQRWNVQNIYERDSISRDNVSMNSTESLLDDDSGMGDSIGDKRSDGGSSSGKGSVFASRSSGTVSTSWLWGSEFPGFDSSMVWHLGTSTTPSWSPYSPERHVTASGYTQPWVAETMDGGERGQPSDTTASHIVNWRPKRNPVKQIFSEKLQWKAVSTIPKVTRRLRKAKHENTPKPLDQEDKEDSPEGCTNENITVSFTE